MLFNQEFLDLFTDYDDGGSSEAEIKRLELLRFESDDEQFPDTARLIVVLVDPRYFQSLPGALSSRTVLNKLKRMKEDLWLEGYASRFIMADVYSDRDHQDGRTVLAIRKFFKKVKRRWPKFQGSILIGSFPEPMLVRRSLRQHTVPKTIEDKESKSWFQIVPEIISERSDIVLEDLSGKWDEIYEQSPKQLDSIVAAVDDSLGGNWNANSRKATSKVFTYTKETFEDFFWIQDDDTQVLSVQDDEIRFCVGTEQRHPELSDIDKRQPNPIARPDIRISRINPLHIAVSPDPEKEDKHGNTYLDDSGNPQAMEFTHSQRRVGDLLFRDPILERELLCDYLDRNHKWRSGKLEVVHRTASIAYPYEDFKASSYSEYLNQACARFHRPKIYENANLLDYIDFLKRSAILKGVVAHSDSWGAFFGDEGVALSDLDMAFGGKLWRWNRVPTETGYRYEPGFRRQGGKADIYLYRTIYANKLLNDADNCFYIHKGCQVNSPAKADSKPYNSETYGWGQHAEAMLFYAKGLAMVSRAKVFNDDPTGFPEAFGRYYSSRFGDGLSEYFSIEANDERLSRADKVADCKRAYTWSITGDWTLRLRPVPTTEDSIKVNPWAVRLRREGSHWHVAEGSTGLYRLDNQHEAARIQLLIRHYELDELCTVGRPNPSFSFWLSDGELPRGREINEDSLSFDIHSLEVKAQSGKFGIYAGNGRYLFLSPTEEEAEQAIRLIRKYRGRRMCYVGRPNPSMCYMRR